MPLFDFPTVFQLILVIYMRIIISARRGASGAFAAGEKWVATSAGLVGTRVSQ